MLSLPLSLCSLCLCGENAFAFASSAGCSLTAAATALTFATRRTYESHPLQMRHFGGTSRASRRHKMSIQRLAPSNPPVISAEIMQNLRIFKHSATLRFNFS